MNKNKTTIQAKILRRLVPSVIILLVVLTIVITHQSMSRQKSAMENHQVELAKRVTSEVATKIHTMTEALKWLAQQNTITSMEPEQFVQTIEDYLANNTEDYYTLFVAYPTGKYYVANKGFQKVTIDDRKYFKDIFIEKKEYAMTSPDVSRSTGDIKYTLAVPIKDHSGNVKGLLAANIKLNTLGEIINSIKTNHSTFHIMCDEKANIIAAKDHSIVMTRNLLTNGQEIYKGIEEIGKAIKDKKNTTHYITKAENDEEFYSMNFPIENTPGWYIVSAGSTSPLKEMARNMIMGMTLFIILIITLLIFIINITLTRLLTSPLNILSKSIKSISDGKISQVVKYHSNDEIGEMANNLQDMCEQLSSIVKTIKEGAESLVISSNIVNESSQKVSYGTTQQASSIDELSATMEEMCSNIEQNTENANITNKTSQDASQKFLEVVKNINKVLKTNEEIATKSSIINDIAYQTNILALNAAVEAARAGDYGKGFAVVASEVRKLAENAKKAADEIMEMSQAGLNNSAEVNLVMKETVPQVEKTSVLVKEIASASMEQNIGASQINNVIQNLTGVVRSNSEASEILASQANELAMQADNLQKVTEYFKD